MISTIGIIYISGVIVSLILTILLYSYCSDYKECIEVIEFTKFGYLTLLSWITVVRLVYRYRKQIKEMLSFKRNDNTAV